MAPWDGTLGSSESITFELAMYTFSAMTVKEKETKKLRKESKEERYKTEKEKRP